MIATRSRVMDEVLDLMTELAGDWEYSGLLTPETRLLRDLNLESLGLVVLGEALQRRYGPLPFSRFYAEIGELPPQERDVSIRDLVEFVCRNRTGSGNGGGQ